MKSRTQKTLLLLLVCLFFSLTLHADESLSEKVKKLPDLPAKTAQELLYQLTISYISTANDTDRIATNKNILLTALEESNISAKKAFAYEIEALAAKKLRKLEEAKRYILLALKESGEGKPQIPRLLNILAFIETDLENYMGAMESYLMVGKIYQKNRDTTHLVANYNNIADLYIKNNLYQEAINALNQATELAIKHKDGVAPYFIYQNKATAYFYLQNLDSLQYYAKKTLSARKNFPYNIIAEHRLKYMELFLKKDTAVIDAIKLVANNYRDQEHTFTTIHLARAYLLFDKTPEAKELILKLLSSPTLKDPGYTRSILYDLLGDTYQKEKNFELSSHYYEKGMDQSLLNAENMMRTGSILTFLKYDEIKNKYVLAQENMKVKKNYFMLLMALALVVIIALIFLYRSARVKKKYNELMYNKLNKEISFMNSHEVRRYLSNIQGIIMVIQMSEDKKTAYVELEDALFDSAEHLDNSIRNIVNKLHDHTESSYRHTG